MAEQALDLRSAASILRRRYGVLLSAALLGILAGIGAVVALPPDYSSTSLVLLPPAQDQSGASTTREVQTEVSIAESDVVLGAAGRALEPAISLRTLRRRVDITAVTVDILQIEARADSPALAEQTAQAIAAAEIAYVRESVSTFTSAQQSGLAQRREALETSLDKVKSEVEKTDTRIQDGDPSSVQGMADATALSRLTAEQARLVLQIDAVNSEIAGAAPLGAAKVIQQATPGERPSHFTLFGFASGLGLMGGLLSAIVVVLALAKRDRRMRYRDDISDALGGVVIGSIRSNVPHTVAGWATFMETHQPHPVEARALQPILRRLNPTDASTSAPSPPITVISLSGDTRALSFGPQIAVYAALMGITVRLVAGRGHESASALWAACFRCAAGQELRPGLVVDVSHEWDGAPDTLTIVLAVVDRHRPDLRGLPGSAVVVVSPGTATAQDLARLAVTADGAGIRIEGIVVADPDDLDRTTGRLPRREREQQVPLPTRLTGVPKYRPDASGSATRGRST